MTESVQQYVERILNALGSTDPLQQLSETPSILKQVLEQFPSVKLHQRPSPEKWSPAEIAIHLSEVEMVVGVRVRIVLGNNGAAIQAFDQDAWARRYAKTDLQLSLAGFEALRAANLALYRSLSPDQWEQYGMHAERGKETVRRIVTMCAGHDLNHLRQLQALAG